MCDAHVMFPTSSADFTCVTFVFPCGPTCVAPITDPEQFPFQYRVEQGADGWQLSADGSRADLMGLTCDEALNGRFSTISFEFGCTDVPVLR